MDSAAPDPLRAVRMRIDAIDEAMHRLLIERSGVIAELIRIKGAASPGIAFRPDREADMMRRLALRHEGDLPLTTVEHIWREIITTFTAMQAPFQIAAGSAADPLALRDVIRFYFGFAIPIRDCADGSAAIAAIEGSAADVAVIAAESAGRWWGGLAAMDAPKIFAKLPFIEEAGRPAGLPAYVIGPPTLESRVPPDVNVAALADAPGAAEAVERDGGRIVSMFGGELLAELPAAVRLDELRLASARRIGGFHQPIRVVGPRIA